MEIKQRDYIRYKRFALVITQNQIEEAEDLLQDVLLKILEKEVAKEKLSDEYIFISLKNTWLNKKRKQTPFDEVETLFEQMDTTIEDISVLIEKEETINEKLKAIDEVYHQLPIFDKQLFYIHLLEGISQRRISKETEIGMTVINNKINNIKAKIRNTYGK